MNIIPSCLATQQSSALHMHGDPATAVLVIGVLVALVFRAVRDVITLPLCKNWFDIALAVTVYGTAAIILYIAACSCVIAITCVGAAHPLSIIFAAQFCWYVGMLFALPRHGRYYRLTVCITFMGPWSAPLAVFATAIVQLCKYIHANGVPLDTRAVARDLMLAAAASLLLIGMLTLPVKETPAPQACKKDD